MLKTLIFSIWFIFHPVHVTLTSIDFIPETDSFKVFVRMYFDDFLLDCKLNNEFIQKEYFSGEDSTSINFMEKYLKENIFIKVNDNQLSAKLLNMNMADNELSMNLEYKYGKKPESITVKNLIMTGLYTDQANMVIVRVKEFEVGIKLTSELKEQTFIIK
jgi:hypothetical protein